MDYSIPTTVPPPSNNDWFNSATYHDMRSVVNATYEIPYPSTVTLKYTNFGTSSDQIETIDAGSVHDDKGSSSTSDSMSPDTILMPMVKRGRPTENPCWSYFHRIDDQLVRCRICTKLVKSACATNMTKHLERHHSDDYEKLAEQIRLYRINDASFRTKIQYLTHMNPPEDDATSYLIPKEEFTTVPQTYSTPATTVPQNYTEYFDPSTSSDTNWQLSHFWDQPQHQAPITVLHPPPTVIQSTSTVPSVPTVLPTVPILATVPAAKRPWNGGGAVGGGGERPYMKRNRKTEHPVWEYFKRTGDGNAECTICGGVVKSPCSSNFMRHLMRHHTPEYNDVYMKWVQKRNQTGGGPPTQQM